MDPSYFSYEALATTAVVFLCFAGSFVLIGNGVELVRKWVAAHKEKGQELEDKVDFLKGENVQHRNNYQDVVNIKRQMGKIEENVQKIDDNLDKFIESHNKEMNLLNEETALQTSAIKSLLDSGIDNNHNTGLIEQRQKIDDFLIHRGR